MKLMRLFPMVGLVLGLSVASAPAGDEGWMTDFDAARKAAAEQKKDLYVNFTGSDW